MKEMSKLLKGLARAFEEQRIRDREHAIRIYKALSDPKAKITYNVFSKTR